MGRVKENYIIINTPLNGFIYKDLQKFADVWMSMQRKGETLLPLFEW